MNEVSRTHGGRAIRWLGDGGLLFFDDVSAAFQAALELSDRAPAAGLPPTHIGVQAGPVVFRDGDVYGRTVNVASRIADEAEAGSTGSFVGRDALSVDPQIIHSPHSIHAYNAGAHPERHRHQGEAMRESLIRVSDIPTEGTVTVDLLGREVLVMLLNGKPRAYVNVCMHHGGPLSLEGDTFTCEWHGSTFDARTGKALSGPVRPDARLIMLPTRVEEGVLTYVYEE